MNTLAHKVIIYWIIFLLQMNFSMLYPQVFEEVSNTLNITHYNEDQRRIAGGVAIIDYNLDHYPDIFLIGGSQPDRLFKNTANGEFVEVTQEASLSFLSNYHSMGVGKADLNNDGFPELIISTVEREPLILLKNNGDGTFSNITVEAGLAPYTDWSTSISFADVNLDGLLDIYVGNYVRYTKEPYDENLQGGLPNLLFINLGNFQFKESAMAYQVRNDNSATLSATFLDVNGDHAPDLWIGNDFGQNFSPNALYINQYPEPFFLDKSAEFQVNAEINSMGFAKADYDQDALLDIYISNMADNLLYFKEDSLRQYSEIAQNSNASVPAYTSWGSAFLDINNDRQLELAIANGAILDFNDSQYQHPNTLFSCQLDQFIELKESGIEHKGTARGLAIGDIDGDGLQDIIINQVNLKDQTEHASLIYKNISENTGNYIRLLLEGQEANRQGIGAKVYVYISGQFLYQELDGGSSYLSAHEASIHFGLGDKETIDSVKVIWPKGKETVYTNLDINQAYILKETGNSQEIIPRSPIVLSTEESIENNLNIYSLGNELVIDHILGEAIDLKIYSIRGHLLYTKNIQQESSLSLNLPRGLYIVHALQGKQFIYKKLLLGY